VRTQQCAIRALRQYQFLNDWLLGGNRKIVPDQINLVSNFLCGNVGILLQQERYEYLETPSTEVERNSSIPEIVLTVPALSVISVSISCGDARGF
jgi:hypothetical protein